MNIDIYSTVAGELPKLVEKKEPMCFVCYKQFLEYQKQTERKIKELEDVVVGYRKMSCAVLMAGRE